MMDGLFFLGGCLTLGLVCVEALFCWLLFVLSDVFLFF